MYVLYYSPGTASMAVHLVLLEIGTPHELRLVDVEAGAQRSPEYLRLNPGGTVPTLLIDAEPRSETAALLLLLAERHPEADLAPPPGSPQRSAFLQWMLYLANTVQPAFRLWFYPHELCGEAHSERVKQGARQRLDVAWQRIDDHLHATGPWMAGDRYSIADIYCTMLMRWSRNMPRPATQWPRAKALADRVRARPAWQRLNEIETLSEWA